MYPFSYKQATSVDEAVALLGSGDDPKLLAGGQTLLPTMKQRLASPSDLIDIGGLADLKGIAASADSVRVGAGETHHDVSENGEVKSTIPALAELAGNIGDPHVRHRGTLGGSIANNDPAADYPAACLALKAMIATNTREIAADDFFTGMFETALSEDEIVMSVAFSAPEKAAYMKFPNPASRYAMVGVFVAKYADEVRVAVTGAGHSVFRVHEMEAALDKEFAVSSIEGLSVSDEGLNSDIHGSAEYRAHLVGVMARRAVAKALEI